MRLEGDGLYKPCKYACQMLKVVQPIWSTIFVEKLLFSGSRGARDGESQRFIESSHLFELKVRSSRA